jgi:hypothetical protein
LRPQLSLRGGILIYIVGNIHPLWTIKWVSCLITEVAFKRLELAVVRFG